MTPKQFLEIYKTLTLTERYEMIDVYGFGSLSLSQLQEKILALEKKVTPFLIQEYNLIKAFENYLSKKIVIN